MDYHFFFIFLMFMGMDVVGQFNLGFVIVHKCMPHDMYDDLGEQEMDRACTSGPALMENGILRLFRRRQLLNRSSCSGIILSILPSLWRC